MAKETGYIRLYRKMCGWEWYKNTNTLALFIHLLLNANFSESKFEGQIIRRGQLVTSLPTLCNETGLTMQQVRTALKHLSLTGEITSKSYRRFRIIAITKYDDFQSVTDKATGTSTAYQQEDNRLLTGCQQATNIKITGYQQHHNNINNINNKKMEKGNNNILSPSNGFDNFWLEYPRKVAKQDALKAWNKIWKNEQDQIDLFAKIMDGLDRWIKSDEWQRDDGRYIPHPATWLNGRRWEDEVKQRTASQTSAPVRQIPANNFEQRDYSDVPDEMMAQLAADLKRFNETGQA